MVPVEFLLMIAMCTKASKTFPTDQILQTYKLTKETTHDCECYNVTENEVEYECRCSSKNLMKIPHDLERNVTKLIINDADIKYINKRDLDPYRKSLKDLTLSNLPHLRVIEEGTFGKIPNLRTIYITLTPQLKFVHGLLKGVTSKKFYSLRIVQTGLFVIPDLSQLPNENIMHLLDLDQNQIERLTQNSIKVRAEQVTLNYNEIEVVENFAFNASQIGKLNLRGNKKLTTLEPDAFNGLRSLQELDLSETSIQNLPVVGISEIETLRIEKTPSMKIIPSIYDLQNLKTARLTHHFHCCAFKYPKRHNPLRHAQHEEMVKRFCQEEKLVIDTGQLTNRKKIFKRFVGDFENQDGDTRTTNFTDKNSVKTPFINPQWGKTIDYQEAKPIEDKEDFGTFHGESAEIPNTYIVKAFCGNISYRISHVKCFPEPNALNPCEDIMGSSWLRISVWFVVVFTVIGNVAVIIVVTFSGGEVSVTRFLICNLAIADLCMGLYLLLIASMDLHSVGIYFNFAFDWQYGIGCQLAGFLTVFASHLSIYTLTVVTVERWFAITYAIYLTRRIHIGTAAKIMVCGWLYSIFIASLPLFGVSNYSSTSICLPMEVNRNIDRAYLYSIILLNGVAFALIVFCYAKIYLSLGYETRNSQGEMTIAKKMALLIFTDFATWAPIAFFAVTALAGYPLIGVTRSKILLVFFYPLNSCANPYLYAIMTAQYRKDFFVLASRCGICKRRARKYTGSSSLPAVNNSHPIPLLARANGKCENACNNCSDDVFL